MKKIISLIITITIIFLPTKAHAGLDFSRASSSRVIVPAATSLNTLPNMTVLMWVYPTSIAARTLIRKGNLVSTGWNFSINATTGTLRSQVAKNAGASVDNYISNAGFISTPNKWYCLVMSRDVAGAANERINIYTGDLTTPLTEVTYATIQDGTGAQVNDSGVDIAIGNIPITFANSFAGYIANVIIINRTVSLGELRSLQYNPRVVSGTVGYWQLGYNGTGTQTDYSGKQNVGTVGNATTTIHVPLRSPFGM